MGGNAFFEITQSIVMSEMCNIRRSTLEVLCLPPVIQKPKAGHGKNSCTISV